LRSLESEEDAEAPPFYILGEKMSKPFITYDEQIKKLKDEKNLNIENEEFAKEALQNISYYALISGYKHPFIDMQTRKYMSSTHFEDIVALYYFDEDLRSLFFKNLCKVECKIRSLISYHFTEKHGEQQSTYLEVANYSNSPRLARKITKLIQILSSMANVNKDHEYINYQRTTYNNVSLWVLMKALTFGQVSKMFQFLPQNLQGQICKNFSNVEKHEMIKYMRVLTLYRNVCAHSERLFSYNTHIDIPDTELHKKLNISKNGIKYDKGKNDLFSVVIAFRYLLPKEEFLLFKKRLIQLLKDYANTTHPIWANILYEHMGFPENWEHITRFHKI
jgi:Abortive infection bacteriophage resistance protein